MTRLEFWDEKKRQVIANVQAGETASVPNVGDLVYIPHGEDSGVYALVRVKTRQFYFSQQGDVPMIRLACEVAEAEPAANPLT